MAVIKAYKFLIWLREHSFDIQVVRFSLAPYMYLVHLSWLNNMLIKNFDSNVGQLVLIR